MTDRRGFLETGTLGLAGALGLLTVQEVTADQKIDELAADLLAREIAGGRFEVRAAEIPDRKIDLELRIRSGDCELVSGGMHQRAGVTKRYFADGRPTDRLEFYRAAYRNVELFGDESIRVQFDWGTPIRRNR